MATLTCIGISYRTAPSALRDCVSLPPDRAAAFLAHLAALGIRQAMVLSTCNRCEVFSWGEGSVVEAAYRAQFAPTDLSAALARRTGTEALTYLFRIAAGLESMVLGEYQILGQVKDAYAFARAHGTVGKELDRILRDAITAAKRVKTELDLGAVPPSVCRAGMRLAARRFGLAGKRVFVIGSGKTGTLAVRLAREGGAASVAVCNRSPERARHLATEYGAHVVDYAARYETIAASDLVVSATASPHVVVSAERVALDHPTFFLDLALPHDVDAGVRAMALATLADIDTIGELAAGNRAERDHLTALGMDIIDGAVRETSAWLARAADGKEAAP